jgi:hypothetical protein
VKRNFWPVQRKRPVSPALFRRSLIPRL